MSEWKKVKFGSLYAIDSSNGVSKPSGIRGSGNKMINMGELFNYDRIFDIPTELVPLNEKEQIKFALDVGDLLFARQSLVLEGAGKCSIVMQVPELTVFESHLIRVRLNSRYADPLFYYYFFRSCLSPVKTIVSQCAQAGIRGSELKELEVSCPPLPIQRRIAGILSAYDDLIENNRKQIKFLEEAARRLYKEWFVDLRFPGHENTKIVDGLPEGWSRKKLGEMGKIITGKTPSTVDKDNYGGNIPFIKIPDMHGKIYPIKTETYITEKGANKSCLIQKDVVMVSCIATVGLVSISVDRCQTNQQINSLILSEGENLYYVYFALRNMQKLLDGVGSNGATMTNVNKSKFSAIEIIVPTKELVHMYYSISEHYFRKIYKLEKQIMLLQEARDRLLPKLMSGEIEAENSGIGEENYA